METNASNKWYMKMFSGSCNVNLFSSRHDIINANIAPLFHFSKENSCILSYLIWKVACIDDLNWNLPVLDNSMYLSHIKNNTLIILKSIMFNITVIKYMQSTLNKHHGKKCSERYFVLPMLQIWMSDLASVQSIHQYLCTNEK